MAGWAVAVVAHLLTPVSANFIRSKTFENFGIKMPPQYKSKKSFKTARFEGFFAFISSKA